MTKNQMPNTKIMKAMILTICGWVAGAISSFFPERSAAPIRIFFHDLRRQPAIALANAAEAITNLIGAANEISDTEEWIQISPLGDFPHAKGIQRVDTKAVQAMANHFTSLRSKLSRRFGGLPFFVGHPDVAGLANEYPDNKAYGWIMEVEARADGLWGKTKWSEAGKQMLANAHYKFFSPHWNAEAATENGKRILRPVELVSVGLTNKPNLPVNPLANAAETENQMKREDVLKMLQLGNEATDEQITQRAAALVAAFNTLAIVQTDKQAAETALASVRAEKSAVETDLANTRSTLETTKAHLESERDGRITILVENAVLTGKIREPEAAQWKADLKTDFAGKSVALANAKPAVKTESKTGDMGKRRDSVAIANEQERRGKVLGLVNAKMKDGLDYDTAWAQVQREQPALFEAMTKPESNN